MSTQATTTAEHATHWVDDWILRHGVTLTPAAKGALRDLLVDQTAELERGHHRFGELTDERRGAIAERDRLAALVAERDAEIERLRRERTHGTTRRGCLALDCWTEFELFSPDDPATGWKQAHALGGYLCPVHAELLEAHLPRPAYTPQRMTCSCGWESVPVHHRGAGTELWLDHAHEVTEARDASRAPESPTGAATPRSPAVDAPTKGVSGPRGDR